MKKVKLSPLCAIWILILFQFQARYIIPLLCAIILHELGHLTVAKILKIQIKCLEISILGARIVTQNELSYKDEFMLALGGPFAGFLGFLFTLPISVCNPTPLDEAFLLPFSLISLCLTLFNLIPLATLDGGRMLFCVLCITFPLNLASKIMSVASFLTLFSFWIFSVYLVLKASLGLSMLVFCAIFFSKCFIFGNKNRDYARF